MKKVLIAVLTISLLTGVLCCVVACNYGGGGVTTTNYIGEAFGDKMQVTLTSDGNFTLLVYGDKSVESEGSVVYADYAVDDDGIMFITHIDEVAQNTVWGRESVTFDRDEKKQKLLAETIYLCDDGLYIYMEDNQCVFFKKEGVKSDGEEIKFSRGEDSFSGYDFVFEKGEKVSSLTYFNVMTGGKVVKKVANNMKINTLVADEGKIELNGRIYSYLVVDKSSDKVNLNLLKIKESSKFYVIGQTAPFSVEAYYCGSLLKDGEYTIVIDVETIGEKVGYIEYKGVTKTFVYTVVKPQDIKSIEIEKNAYPLGTKKEDIKLKVKRFTLGEMSEPEYEIEDIPVSDEKVKSLQGYDNTLGIKELSILLVDNKKKYALKMPINIYDKGSVPIDRIEMSGEEKER